MPICLLRARPHHFLLPLAILFLRGLRSRRRQLAWVADLRVQVLQAVEAVGVDVAPEPL